MRFRTDDIDGEQGLAQWRANNPPPTGVTYDPATWPEEIPAEEMSKAYGAVVVWTAVAWADEMERLLDAAPADEPVVVADIASEAFNTVNDALGVRSLTGFQYGIAVSLLAQTWEHGEELRIWHNLKEQIGDEGERANAEGGVLNPALINFGTTGDKGAEHPDNGAGRAED